MSSVASARSELDGLDWVLPAARNKVDLVRPLSVAALAALADDYPQDCTSDAKRRIWRGSWQMDCRVKPAMTSDKRRPNAM